MFDIRLGLTPIKKINTSNGLLECNAERPRMVNRYLEKQESNKGIESFLAHAES